MPQFDLMSFEVSICTTMLTFLMFYLFNLTVLIPNFIEGRKLRLKKCLHNKVLSQSLVSRTVNLGSVLKV